MQPGGCGGNTPGPPIFLLSNPLAAKAASRIISASNRRRFCRASNLLYGSIFAASARALLDWRYTAEVTIRRCITLRLQFTRMNSVANQSSKAWLLGGRPWVPKSFSVSTSPIPKYLCHIRFTVTRARRGLRLLATQRAKARRSDFSAFGKSCRTDGTPGSTFSALRVKSPFTKRCVSRGNFRCAITNVVAALGLAFFSCAN